MKYRITETADNGLVISKKTIEAKTLAAAKAVAARTRKCGFGSTVVVKPEKGLSWERNFPGEWTYH